jgi:hypothetical protein
MVMLDAAKLATCTPLDLSEAQPDFIAVSFYKVSSPLHSMRRRHSMLHHSTDMLHHSAPLYTPALQLNSPSCGRLSADRSHFRIVCPLNRMSLNRMSVEALRLSDRARRAVGQEWCRASTGQVVLRWRHRTRVGTAVTYSAASFAVRTFFASPPPLTPPLTHTP